MLAGFAALGALATTIMLPAFPAMAHDLSVGQPALAWTLSAFFVNFAVGQLIVGPLTDAIGRSRPVFIALALFALAAQSVLPLIPRPSSSSPPFS
jgi:DHA1 family bicyclomycin/chloramphenicol resistance-like MFS transporter